MLPNTRHFWVKANTKMNTFANIRSLIPIDDCIPGKLYYIGLRIKEEMPYHDTKKLHWVESFKWIEFNFSHTGNGFNFRQIHSVMYDYRHTELEKLWFEKKCTDLFKMGFQWSEAGGTFSLPRTWSAYWEQVARYNEQQWKEYIETINEAISDKDKYLTKQNG